MDRLLSVVVSVYSEEKALEELYRETTEVLRQISWDYELLFVNDGSRDGGQGILDRLAASGLGVRAISSSRNFGHETAMIAGLDYSRGGGIICMDADLQYPPEYIPDTLAKLEEGYQIINMVCTRNRTARPVENITSLGFYWLINWISNAHFEADVSDFFAVFRHVAQVLKDSYREKVRFLRSYVQSVGFKKAAAEYETRVRMTGESKYNIRKLFVFSINTILCFSNMPLKLGIYAGIFLVLLGFAVMIYTLCTRRGTSSGYTTIVVLICSMFTMIFVIIGTIGEYVAILFTELKDRSIHIVDRTENMDQGESVDQTTSITDRTENRNQTKSVH